MLRDGTGNCVDYSILQSAVLLRLGIPHWYDVVSFDKPNEYNHIYVQTDSGTILDPVPPHKQDGTDTRQNRPNEGWFNYTTPYKYRIKYYMPQLEILQGTKTASPLPYGRSRRIRQARSFGSLGCSNLGCTVGCGCSQNKTLGGTVVGDIFRGIADVGKGILNVTVTPIEGIINRQIYDPTFSSTGFGSFVDTSMDKNSALNAGIANIVSGVFIQGAVKAKDVNKSTSNQSQYIGDLIRSKNDNIANLTLQQQGIIPVTADNTIPTTTSNNAPTTSADTDNKKGLSPWLLLIPVGIGGYYLATKK